MSKLGDLWALIKRRVLTPANIRRAGDAIGKAAVKQADNMEAKRGLADPVSLAAILLIGYVLGHGIVTRSNQSKVSITQVGCRDCTNIVNMASQRLEVSGSGGVSIPVTGGGK